MDDHPRTRPDELRLQQESTAAPLSPGRAYLQLLRCRSRSSSSCSRYRCLFEEDALELLKEEDLWSDFLQVLSACSNMKCFAIFCVSRRQLERHAIAQSTYLECLEQLSRTVLQHMTDLTELRIWHYGEQPHLLSVAAMLSQYATQVQVLEIVDLQNQQSASAPALIESATSTAAIVLGEALRRHEMLRSLSLINMDHPHLVIEVLLPAVSTLSSLKDFIFCGRTPHNEPTAYEEAKVSSPSDNRWFAKLLRMPSLRHLGLCSLHLTDEDLQSMATGLAAEHDGEANHQFNNHNNNHNNDVLESLFFKNVRFPSSSTHLMMESLETTKALLQLAVHDCPSLHETELQGLVQAAKRNFCLSVQWVNDDERIVAREGNGVDHNYSNLFRYITAMNKAGRQYIVSDPGSREKGLHVLNTMSHHLDALFLHVQENPVLCQRVVQQKQLRGREEVTTECLGCGA